MGCPAGVGRAGPRGRAVTCPPPPPLRREFQSERARGLLLGRNHPAPRRRVGRRHLTARPCPPRVRGGGSVCSVTNGPSRLARLLARAQRGPARVRSSRGSRRHAALPRAGPRSPPPRRALPARRSEAYRGGRDKRLDRGGAPLADPQVSVQCGRGMLRGQCGRREGPRVRTRVRAMRRLSLQSEPEVSLKLGLLSLPLRVGGSRKNLDLGEGLREILVLRYLTKVEKTH